MLFCTVFITKMTQTKVKQIDHLVFYDQFIQLKKVSGQRKKKIYTKLILKNQISHPVKIAKLLINKRQVSSKKICEMIIY